MTYLIILLVLLLFVRSVAGWTHRVEPTSFYAEALACGDLAPESAADYVFLGIKPPMDTYMVEALRELDEIVPDMTDDLQ